MLNKKEKQGQLILLIAVFVIATCGLVYELVAGTLASYLLGDSVTQFSTIIGVYLFSMGIGSYLSRYIGGNLLAWFIRIELLVGLVGGYSAALLFLLFPTIVSFRILLYALVCLTGTLVGLEIPLLMRILHNKTDFKEMVSRVFTFDYIGALLASLVFPLIFVPRLGLIKTALFFGILNSLVGLYLTYYFERDLKAHKSLRLVAYLVVLVQLAGFIYSEKIMTFSEQANFGDNIVHAESSSYQRIVLTHNRHETRLFLNGNLQFSSADEYRYHEALVHPALSSIPNPGRVLILGGGDGLAAREVLKYPSVKTITLVDLDPAMTRLFTSNEQLVKMNAASLSNNKLKVENADAFVWIRKNKEKFDAILIDFPDPSNFSIGKLYSNQFFREVYRSLDKGGISVIQSTSPLVAPKSFWCVDTTLRSVGFQTRPYHNYVPSFGEWGYIMAFADSIPNMFSHLPSNLKYISKEAIAQMFFFPPDMRSNAPLEINKLNNQALVNYFEAEWGKYLQL